MAVKALCAKRDVQQRIDDITKETGTECERLNQEEVQINKEANDLEEEAKGLQRLVEQAQAQRSFPSS